jgi:ribose 1,5-bisphosphate isomerase
MSDKMGFDRIVKDIKSLKIQGAENIAKEAAKALTHVLDKEKNQQKEIIIQRLNKAKETLFLTRPTEPCMRNTLNFVLAGMEQHKDGKEVISYVSQRIHEAQEFFAKSEERITGYGSQKIKDGMTIYTHCHSSTVTRAIISAWKQGKHIEVHNTETRPRLQGRITASELAKEGIPVTHYVDSAARFALKKADIMLIGADAITSEGKVINKVGSELSAEVAKRYDVPVYVCANSWKFDPETVFGFEEPIEKRYSSEVWEKPPKGVKIDNFAFEQIDPELVTGVVTELGIYNAPALVDIMKKNYRWMFS